ncbi:hypothetical protein [Streptomyces sp. NPDC001811]
MILMVTSQAGIRSAGRDGTPMPTAVNDVHQARVERGRLVERPEAVAA